MQTRNVFFKKASADKKYRKINSYLLLPSDQKPKTVVPETAVPETVVPDTAVPKKPNKAKFAQKDLYITTNLSFSPKGES